MEFSKKNLKETSQLRFKLFFHYVLIRSINAVFKIILAILFNPLPPDGIYFIKQIYSK